MNSNFKTIRKLIEDGDISSPGYVFDYDEFKSRAKTVKDAFGPDVDICFSIKANPFLLCGLSPDFHLDFPNEFSKVEVCSPGELEICRKMFVPPEMIIFSGVNKRKDDVLSALNYSPFIDSITIESATHLRYIDECLADEKRKVPALIRLSDESQFGIDEDILVDIIKDRDSHPQVEFVGIHYFTGTGKKKGKEISKELDRLRGVMLRLKEEADYIPIRIEYGAGLGVDYFNQDWLDSSNVEMSLLSEATDAIKSFAAECKNTIPGFKMTVEMGRFFAASCGHYITKICDLKTNDSTNYIIVDGGLHQLKYDGQLQGMKKPKVTHISFGGSPCEEEPWTICGSLCTTADVLVRNLDLKSPAIDDYLVFHQTGAYSVTEGMSAFLSRDLPSVYVFDEANGLIKLREHTELYEINTPKEL